MKVASPSWFETSTPLFGSSTKKTRTPAASAFVPSSVPNGCSVRFCTVTFALQTSSSITGASLFAIRTYRCWLPTTRL